MGAIAMSCPNQTPTLPWPSESVEAAGDKSVPYDFRITGYTSDNEVLQLADLLKEKGQVALRSALEKEDRGRINPV
ncbi:MAG: hypothetical protein DMG61_20000 [Acidobacteria bacterium]|nr:MAG: hypothetical protein DMG61_20000 [Acidobacteriota bacterium]PYY18892.1 MAG: hypothetical protein DMG60_06430 [Acidobacteriota bacterium]